VLCPKMAAADNIARIRARIDNLKNILETIFASSALGPRTSSMLSFWTRPAIETGTH